MHAAFVDRKMSEYRKTKAELRKGDVVSDLSGDVKGALDTLVDVATVDVDVLLMEALQKQILDKQPIQESVVREGTVRSLN